VSRAVDRYIFTVADRETLRIQPEVMQAVSQALSGAAKDLQTRLVELDGQVREMLAGWQGGAGGAYGEAWDLWHKGAGEVQLGLAILAKTVENSGVQFQAQDSASEQTVDGVYRG
jgi:WXG100 family type VII secretion target